MERNPHWWILYVVLMLTMTIVAGIYLATDFGMEHVEGVIGGLYLFLGLTMKRSVT